MNIRYKVLTETAKAPFRGSQYAAGYDLYSDTDSVTIEPGESKPIGTGIVVEIPGGYFGAIFARSGLACKKGLRPANCVGVIDEDYRGEIMVVMHNDSKEVKVIQRGERIAQLVILPYQTVEFCKADDLSDSTRGNGGFGSTGVR